MNNRIYSVGKINAYIKNLIGSDFILKNISVKGEVSNCKYNHLGHIYFSLKDETGVLSCVMFASSVKKLAFHLEDGLKVVSTGRISVYEKSGVYQLYVNSVEKEGRGDLYKKYEELKNRLEESGLFAEEYKQPIPEFSMDIGVVTAKTGAVINDIRNVAKRRNPYCKITLYNAKVQGEGASEQICAGINALDGLGLDCMIVGRGGGSIEDLWAFNEESVARAIFNCKTPVISAVGHETDFTIADLAADLRAPTPSAAAELAVFDYFRFTDDLDSYKYTFDLHMENALIAARNKVKDKKITIEKSSPENAILSKRQSLMGFSDVLERRMESSLRDSREKILRISPDLERKMERALRESKEKMIRSSARLEGLSPLKRLSEGYAFVEGKDKKGIKSIEQVSPGDEIDVNLSDGRILAEVKQYERRINP